MFAYTDNDQSKAMIRARQKWLTLLLFLQFTRADHYYDNRIVVTFYRKEDNLGQFFNLTDSPVVVAKQYGRRLVLSLPYSIEKVADLYGIVDPFIDPIFIESIEPDARISLSTPPVFHPRKRRRQLADYNDSISYQQLESSIASAFDLINIAGQNFTELNLTDTVSDYYQWNLADSEPFSIHAESIWREHGRGTPDVVIAILDSGLSRAAASAFLNLKWGYDFVSDTGISMDGDGRDLDSEDPGDVDIGCSAWPEPSWHGTKMASILAADHDTQLIKGVAPNVTVMPIRVLGACGSGFANDVADAIVWASGGLINGLTLNPTPAPIISLSLAGTGPCPSYLQSAVNQAISLGSIIIAAAGNGGSNTINDTFPANCVGVVSVGASTKQGLLAAYSNYGSDLVAPGSDILGLSTSLQTPVAISGTSAAVPHVAGVAALLWDGVSPIALVVQSLIQSSKKLNSECVDGAACTANLLFFSGVHPISDYNSNSSAMVFMQTVVCATGTYHNPNNTDQCLSCQPGTYNNIPDSYQPMQLFYAGDLVSFRKTYTYLYIQGGQPAFMNNGGLGGDTSLYYSIQWRFGTTITTFTTLFDGLAALLSASTNISYCFFCKYGYYQNETGATNPCTQTCPFGTYTDGNGPATACQACTSPNKCCRKGEYYNATISTTACTLCAPGTFTYLYDNTVSSPCPSGSYSTGFGSSSCLLCPQGTYQTGSASTICSYCGSGTYQTGTGMALKAKCLLCGVGTYQTGSGMPNCLACGAGMYQTGTGVSSADNCTLCLPGTYQTVTGMTLTANCLLCGAGTYQTGYGMIDTASCIYCPNGKAQTGIGAMYLENCTLCWPGTVSHSTKSYCIGCFPGTYKPDWGGYLLASNCLKCPIGTYSTGNAMVSVDNCTLCLPGTYQPGTGMALKANCLLCGVGTYQTGSGMPTDCPACGAGMYQTGTGMAAPNCSICLQGTYQPATAASVCSPCPQGKYSTAPGQAVCSMCAGGTYSTNLGATSNDTCLACPDQTQSVQGSDSCQPIAQAAIKHNGNAGQQAATIINGTSKRYFRFTATDSDSNAIMFPQNTLVRVLVVAGGGSGGIRHAGGGGAGALIHLTSLQFFAGVEYGVTVGRGGAGQTDYLPGISGGDSQITSFSSNNTYQFAVLARGGGRGGGGSWEMAFPGGSGGGGLARATGGIALTTNIPANAYGFKGGTGSNALGILSQCYAGAGGGGAGGTGKDAINCVDTSGSAAGGDGGDGVANDITGTLAAYAAGGGGGISQYSILNGAIGGWVSIESSRVTIGGFGGKGTASAGNAVANTGSGGGGGGFSNAGNGASGAGADGVVILQWDCCSYCTKPTPCANNTFARCTSFATNICCGPGTYFIEGVHTTCQTCPEGTYGDGSMTVCQDCGVGTYQPAAAASACLKCAVGTTSLGKSTAAEQCLNITQPIIRDVAEYGWIPSTINGTSKRYVEFKSTAQGNAIVFPQNTYVRVLVVAGGGSGGVRHAGGGGAGALIHLTSLQFLTGVEYSVTVGKGGAGQTKRASGQSGTDSSITSFNQGGAVQYAVMARGGGGGGQSSFAPSPSGGSGGGGCWANAFQGGSAMTTNIPIAVGGFKGGNAAPPTYYADRCAYVGGGGGGSGAQGQDVVSCVNENASAWGGSGGMGMANDITGTFVAYAAGGGGGISYNSVNTAGAGGTVVLGSTTVTIGGAGSKGSVTAGDAVANTGSGGGGSGYDAAGDGISGSGADGIVILQWDCCSYCSKPTPCPNQTFARCTSFASNICCGPGTYFVEGVHTACQACPEGTYGDGSATACTDCAVGTYQPALGASACLKCAVGTTSLGKSTAAEQCLNITQPIIRDVAEYGRMPSTINGTAKRYVEFKSTAQGNAIVFPQNTSCRVLVVAGGGSGGVTVGGGGAGAMIHLTSVEFQAGVEYTVTVGLGGLGKTYTVLDYGNDGGNSSISSTMGTKILAIGGGGGAKHNNNGKSGGSGGGGPTTSTKTQYPGSALSSNIPSGIFGNSGGYGSVNGGGADYCGIYGYCYGGGGGGGAGSTGFDAVRGYNDTYPALGGKGGNCIANDIAGVMRGYAAGGGGGVYYANYTGLGGGCNLSTSVWVTLGGQGGWGSLKGSDAVANTGSGGGGSGFWLGDSGSGSDGIVILQWDCCSYCSKPTLCPNNTFARCTSFASNICCGPGTYFLEGVHTACQQCPAGTYGNGSTTACTNCAVGTYQPDPGMSMPADCLACTGGTYQSAPGGSSCLVCPNQTWSVQGSDACKPTYEVAIKHAASVGGQVPAVITATQKRYFRFTATGNDQNAIKFPQNTSVRVLVVAGGGSGGVREGGGGGAGALIHIQSVLFSAAVEYRVVVGAGGAANPAGVQQTAGKGNSGADSAIARDNNAVIVLARGGGGGGQEQGGLSPPGGSGGGGSTGAAVSGGVALSTNIPTGVYGYDGGSGPIEGFGIDRCTYIGAGGGGAGGMGQDAVNCVDNTSSGFGGRGGDGVLNDITGAPAAYAAGGGGGIIYNTIYTGGLGGIVLVGGASVVIGGYGAKGIGAASNGVANTGSGGGGGGFNGNDNGVAGSGSDGVVILQWDCCSYCTQPTLCPNNTIARCTSFASNICCGPGTYFIGGFHIDCQTCPAGTYGDGSMTVCTDCAAGTYQPATGASACINCEVGTTSLAKSTAPGQCLNITQPVIRDGTEYGKIPSTIQGTSKRYFEFKSTATGPNAIVFQQNTACKVLVVAGGGGGAWDAGAGAGAMIYQESVTFKGGIQYTVVVGAGGVPTLNGGDSWVSNSNNQMIVLGRGGGASGVVNPRSGAAGGSGGGGGAGLRSGGATLTANIPVGKYGNVGGIGAAACANSYAYCYAGGGGGGAGSAGTNGISSVNGAVSIGGDGGIGLVSNITGRDQCYAAGGGGGGGATWGGKGGGCDMGNNLYATIGWQSGYGNPLGELKPVANTGSGAGGSGVFRTGADGIVILQWDCCSYCTKPTPCATNTIARCTSFASNICCGPGTYFLEGVHTDCQQCAAGTYSDGSTTACTDCVVGTYSDGSTTACTDCAVGTYQPATAASACLKCATGTTSWSKSAKCSNATQPLIRHANADEQTPATISGTARRYFEFKSTANTNAFMFPQNTSCRVLVVAGGGGGGVRHAGGGGAGALIHLTSLEFFAGVEYSVTVGRGGASDTGLISYGNFGMDSWIKSSSDEVSVLARGGGCTSLQGGSGGGSFPLHTPGIALSSNVPLGVYGFDGGQGSSLAVSVIEQCLSGGGGGGAGSIGENAQSCISGTLSSRGGNGGGGVVNDITGTPTAYAAGGGGGNSQKSALGPGAGGQVWIGSSLVTIGGSGSKGLVTAGNALANTGSGGGGSGLSGNYSGISGSGADGIVILQWDCCSYCTKPTQCANNTFARCTSFASNICCGPGTYFIEGVHTACQACPAGTYGNGSTTACTNCAAGTYQPAAAASACLGCEAGTYAPAAKSAACLPCKTCTAYGQTPIGSCPPGSVNDTVVCVCVADFYYETQTNTCKRCPANTFSLSSPTSSSLLDCRCVAGYVCTYTKKIYAVITLNSVFLQTFNYADQQAFKASVAKAASVPIENVRILEIVSHGGRRLLAALGQKSIMVRLEILDSASVDNSQLLKSHGYVQNMTWEHTHHIEATPKYSSFSIFNNLY